MTAVSLSEFLLARYAEDEAWVSTAPAVDFNGSGERWAALVEYASHCMSPARVLAEIEAKRRIVTLVEAYEGVPAIDYSAAKDDSLEAVLRALALPYADHPDYRPEWKP